MFASTDETTAFMTTFNAKYRLTVDDFVALQKAYASLTKRRRLSRRIWIAMIPIIAAFGVFSATQRDWVVAGILFGLAAVYVWLALRGPRFRAKARFDEQRLGDYELALSANADGITISSQVAETRIQWDAILHVSRVPGRTILWTSAKIGILVPDRGFTTSEVAQGAEAAQGADNARDTHNDADVFFEYVRDRTKGRAFP